MRARNTRRPLCEREVHVGEGGEGKRVTQSQTDMIQLRRGGPHSVKIRGRGAYLTARMGFRHPHISALLGHLLATLALSRCHSCTRQHASRDRQGSQHQCQNGDTKFGRKSHTHKSSPESRLEATI